MPGFLAWMGPRPEHLMMLLTDAASFHELEPFLLLHCPDCAGDDTVAASREDKEFFCKSCGHWVVGVNETTYWRKIGDD